MGEQNQGEFFRRCGGLDVARGFAGASKRRVGIADPLRVLDGRWLSGIPDVGDEGVCFCFAPFVRLGRSELAVHHANLVNDGLGGARFGGGQK